MRIRPYSFAPRFWETNVIIPEEMLCSGVNAKSSTRLTALNTAMASTPSPVHTALDQQFSHRLAGLLQRRYAALLQRQLHQHPVRPQLCSGKAQRSKITLCINNT